VARLALDAGAQADLERLADFLVAADAAAAAKTQSLIFDALAILESHPLIGRFAEGGLRELVISRGRSGYLALYEYREAQDLVVILAVRHQREAGFPESR
jgi:plasmid stabilization system protein ParE